DVMSIQLSYSGLRGAARQFAGLALAFSGAAAAAGCASSGSSASGTYHPPATPPKVFSRSSWPGEPGGVHINVSLADRRLYLKEGDEIVQAYAIGVGTDEKPTPQGDYSVRRIVWNPPWVPPNEARSEERRVGKEGRVAWGPAWYR